MVIGEIMVEESHIYDLEEGEILEDEEGEVINISKNFQNSPCHDIGNNLHHTIHSGTEKYFNLREESRYPEKLYLSSEGCFPNQNFYKYPRIKDISEKVRTSRHSSDYNLKNKSSTFKFRKKSRSRSCSVSSSSSNCSCSSCTSCSPSLPNEKTVQPPSHFSGKSGKEKDVSHLPKKRETIESSVKAKPKQKESSSSKFMRERSPNKKLKKLPRKDLVVLRARTNSYRHHLPEKSSKKKVVSRNAKTVKFKSPLRNEKSTRHKVLRKNESLPDAIVETDLTLPKLIPGSLGEMLLKKQLKGELKKDPILPSEKGVSFCVQGKEGNNIKQFIDSSKNFEIVDLCNENEDESEEDELTLRIKALQSAMKTRGLLGMTKANQREDNSKSSTLVEDKNEINPGASSEIDLKISEEVCESQNLSAILVLESDDERKNLENKGCDNLNNNNSNLEERNHSSKTLIEYGKIEKHDFDNERTAVEQPESEEVNNHFKLVKDKCEIASTDMDISNDSFGDSLPTQSENNDESEIKTVESQDSNTICQNSTFPIPVEWAYMIPPPCNTDVPDDDSLNNIRNWCFNQNMFLQSMQESVSNMNPVESWKSAEANSCGVDCYNSSNNVSNYYYQQPLATSETRRAVTYDEYQCDYNSSLVPTVDVTVQSGELRDCHAEQYKSFMSTVIQNNCPQASHKKDQHRDLINIDLKPGKFQNSNLVSVKPDTKLNTVKRRTRKRRRSNRKSLNGSNLPITMKQTQEIDKTEINVIDDDDEDMLRAMLLNEMSLKNQKVSLDKQNLEINNNNNNNNNNKNSNKSRMNARKICSIGNERLVKVGKSLEVSFSNQNPKFRKAGLQTKSKWPVERRLGPKGTLKSTKSQEAKGSEQKFGNDASVRNFSLSKFPPVKPVIININEDSDTEDEHVKKVETVNNCDDLISGIDSFIRSFRNKQTIAQEKSVRTSSILTPKGVSHLSEEKQQEYRRLKQLMISKRKVLQMKSKKAFTSKKLPSSSGDEKDILVTDVDSVECKPNKDVQEKEQNMDMNLSNKFCSNINDSFESKDVRQSIMVNDSTGEKAVSIHLPESERIVKEHLIEVPITVSQILPINKEICNSNSVQNAVVNVHQNLEEEEKKCVRTYEKDESILCSESIDNRNVVNDEPLSTNNSLDYCNVGNEKVLSIGDNLESKDICSSNLQLQGTEEVSELNDCLNESFDSSDESSSSESESSSSSSSSSNDSDTDIEEQTEIDLRNRLLQKRQEFLQKGNDSLSASCGQSPVENRNILLKCEQNIETSSVGSQDEIINSVDSNNHTPLMDNCRENDEVQRGHSPTAKETGEEKENEPTDHIEEEKEEFSPSGDPPLKPILLNSSTDNVESKSIINSFSKRNEAEKAPLTNSGPKSQSVEREVALTPPLKKHVDMNEALRVKQAKTQEKLKRTLGKLQEEINSRILSVEALTSRISDLFLETEKEESFCQNLSNGIIKLLSQINELRKSRKEKKFQITGISAQIFKLLQKVNDDLSFVNKMENFLLQHYEVNQLLLVTSLKKKKKEQEVKRTICLQKFKQLREKLKLLDSQETILNKTFSKPSECTSPRTTMNRRPISVIQPFQQNRKKKLFKLDNRQTFERQRNEGSPSSSSSKWTLNNTHIASKVLTSTTRSPTTVAAAPSEDANCRQQIETMENQSNKYPSEMSEDIASGTINQPENDKFVGDIMLCPYDLLGRCNDDQCIYQHVSAAVDQVKSSVLCSFKNTSDLNRQCQNINKFDSNKAVSSRKLNEQLPNSSKVDDNVLDTKEPSTVFSEKLLAKAEVKTPSKEESSSADANILLPCVLLKEISHSDNKLEINPDGGSNQTSSFLTGKRSACKRKILSYSPMKASKFSKSENGTKIDRTLEDVDKLQFLTSSCVDRTPIDTERKISNGKVTVVFDDQSPEKDLEKSERIPNSSNESAEISGIQNISSPEVSGTTDNHPITVGSTSRNIRGKGKRRGRVTKTFKKDNRVKMAFTSSRTLRSNKRVIRGKRIKPSLPRT